MAYTVFKRLYPENPSQCGVTYVDRTQLWLQKGPTQNSASQVCVDSTGSMFGCVNWSNVGAAVTLARSADGRVHAAYVAGANALRYAVSNLDASEFASEPVGPSTLSTTGSSLSLAIDVNGLPHVVHVLAGQYVYQVKRPGIGWTQAVLQVPAYPSGYAGRPLTGASLTLDDSGLAALVFVVGDSLWFAKETGPETFAMPELVDGGAGFAGHPALARAADESYHASYYRSTSGQEHVYVSSRGANGWGSPTLVASHSTPLGEFTHKRQRMTLTTVSGSSPRIAYPASNPDGGAAIWLAQRSGSTWSTAIAVPCIAPPSGGGGGECEGGDCDPYQIPVRLVPTTGTDDIPELRVPAVQRGLLTVSARLPDGVRPYRLELFDVQGRLVRAISGVSQSSEVTLAFDGVSEPGLYLVRLRAGDRQVVKARTILVR